MDLSDDGLAFLVRWEGRRNRAYDDALGHCTVGIGHLLHPGPCTPDEHARVWTDDEVDELFRTDVARYVEAVNRHVTVPLNQRQFDVLVDFAFNWGIGATGGFPATSVLRLVNAGDFRAAAAELVDGKGPSGRPYDKGLPGVRARRIAEAEWLVRGRELVDAWHPRATRVTPANTSAGTYRVDCPYKLVLHTVEGDRYSPSRSDYYGHQSYPHFTVNEVGIFQHFPIDLAARALYNEGGGVETNTAKAIQVEVVWFAGRIGDLPDAIMANLADLVGWLVDGGVIPLVFAEFQGDGSYGVDAPQRFSGADWYAFAGICGHQHVPENDHWDPGAFPVERLLDALGTPDEEDEMTQEERETQQYLKSVAEEWKRFAGRFDPEGQGDYWRGQDELERLAKAREAGGGGPVDVDVLTEAVTDKLVEKLRQ